MREFPVDKAASCGILIGTMIRVAARGGLAHTAEHFADSWEGIVIADGRGEPLYINQRFAEFLLDDEDRPASGDAVADAARRVALAVAAQPEHQTGRLSIGAAYAPVHLEVRVTSLEAGHYRLLHCRDITRQYDYDLIQSALYRIAAMTGLAEDMAACYKAIHDIVVELLNSRNFYIATYNASIDRLEFVHFVDEFDQAPPPGPLGNGLTARVIRTGEPYLYSCDRMVLAKEGVDLVAHPAIDWIGVPLKIGDRVYGAMAVQSYDPGVRYSAHEKDILGFIAEHIALAIERKRAEEELKALSLYDQLTSLYNRRGFLAIASQQSRLALRERQPYAVHFIDLDNMKLINDHHGHGAGDAALQAVAGILRASFRDSDIIARLGGDEFVIFGLLADTADAVVLAGRLAGGLAEFNRTAPLPFALALSSGLAVFDPSQAGKPSLEELMAEADRAMYKDKLAKRAQS
ncbi:MAG: hypothetical protein A2087_01340 [Spirochaetes bacterium GWD1_61_31]|nr:MAG: hypothetical protein A2Y37_00295 [Spirochaetes bacterium GWB1_60_80]OHD28910.1 MAG: hypothetical protein A2004_10770 [Spirochaetes bacterium GWC1_61_12]OHD36767.1 MAG: hypothetical protein A2087_01340 [Spirochaetes bacterium GWD1_61_31]OHD43556.1 MAG: hypothetical protein A2Y35_04765 [Spirochaetes bacterium GWE1_60_18]OHD59023.1 MAG: hypothetical protein A2Y32_01960 [Spirochaetes bacterium GWF1_60_12]HAP43576.1 hypothetical protein [Spirochaetaceae bacterium]